MRKGAETGIREITEGLNRILPGTSGTVLLLETMAGKGSEVGARFEELRQILDGMQMPERVGICLDTCHVFDAGYDIVNDLEAVLDEFDRTIGFEMLRAIHLNDSKNPCGSHKDRHEKIGEGEIGLDALAAIFAHPRLQGLPFILETPNELPGYEREIALLKKTVEKRCGNDTD
jgi:deoxyribonuclease-4